MRLKTFAVLALCLLISACSGEDTQPAPTSTAAAVAVTATTPPTTSTAPSTTATPAIVARGDGWLTYRNDLYEYEVSYPGDWKIEVGTRLVSPAGDFETQRVELRRDAGAQTPLVTVYVNLQGDWCLGSRNVITSISDGGFQDCTTSASPTPARTLPNRSAVLSPSS